MFESGLRHISLKNNDFSANQRDRDLTPVYFACRKCIISSSTKATVFVNGFGMLAHSGE